MRGKPVIVAVAMLVVGCYDHQREVDAAVDALDPCTVAGYQQCNACGRDYQWCQEGAAVRGHCIDGLCIPSGSNLDSSLCSDEDSTCPGEYVCVNGIWMPSTSTTFGQCMPESFCDDLTAAGHPMHCIWSDGTDRVTGAPAEIASCPAPVDPGTPFCGSPCGGCAELTSNQIHYPNGSLYVENHPACIGRSDTRQLGVCGIDLPCRRGDCGADDVCVQMVLDQRYPFYPELGLDCACVVFHDASHPDGLSDHGYATRAETCRAYRDMYPGEVDCVTGRGWDRLPD